jgi:hypothetical protein
MSKKPTFAISIIGFSNDNKYQLGLYVNDARSRESAIGMAIEAYAAAYQGYAIAKYIADDIRVWPPAKSPEPTAGED